MDKKSPDNDKTIYIHNNCLSTNNCNVNYYITINIIFSYKYVDLPCDGIVGGGLLGGGLLGGTPGGGPLGPGGPVGPGPPLPPMYPPEWPAPP